MYQRMGKIGYFRDCSVGVEKDRVWVDGDRVERYSVTGMLKENFLYVHTIYGLYTIR